jgi:hypothetical protein
MILVTIIAGKLKNIVQTHKMRTGTQRSRQQKEI